MTSPAFWRWKASPRRDRRSISSARGKSRSCRQLAAGATTEQIASNLNLSIKTVQNYHYLIKTKTGMRTDAQLVRLAVECGLASL